MPKSQFMEAGSKKQSTDSGGLPIFQNQGYLQNLELLLSSKDLDECYDYDNNDKSFKKLYECLNLNKTFQKKHHGESVILNEASAEEFSPSPFKVNCKIDKTDKILGLNTETTNDRTFLTNINEQSHNELNVKSHRHFKNMDA